VRNTDSHEYEIWFEDVYRRRAGSVAGYARRRVGSQACGDIVTETFTALWRRRMQLPLDRELPWLYSTAGNMIRNWLRAERRRHSLVERIARGRDRHLGVVDDDTEPVEPLVAAALAELSTDDRELLLLTCWEGLNPSEAAAVLDIKPGAARTRLHRARQRFKSLYESFQPSTAALIGEPS